jgi:signal peptidase II
LILALIGGSVVILDQVTKVYIDTAFQLHESLPIIPDLFSITYVRNPGAAFGLFAQRGEQFRSILFSGIAVVALLLLGTMIYQTPKEERGHLLSLSLLLGGAMGNIIDRIRLGEVIDFLDFYIGSYHWPAFNVADSAITVGVTLLMLQMVMEKKKVPHL